jgi:hypothetical protein
MLRNGGKGRLQQIKSAVQIRDGISQGHAVLQKRNRIASSGRRRARQALQRPLPGIDFRNALTG